MEGKIAYAIYMCEVCLVGSRCCGSPISQISPRPRCTIDRNHTWYTYCLFGYLDISWVLQVTSAIAGPLGANRVSYGQVWPLFALPTVGYPLNIRLLGVVRFCCSPPFCDDGQTLL